MFCYKNPPTKQVVLHFIESVYIDPILKDERIKCLCGQEFSKDEILIFKKRPPYTTKNLHLIGDCAKCGDNLERFWRQNAIKL